MLVVADDDVSLNSDSSGMPNMYTWTYSPTVDWLLGQTFLGLHVWVGAQSNSSAPTLRKIETGAI